MTLKITAMEQKRYIEELDKSPITKIFNFLVFIAYIPIMIVPGYHHAKTPVALPSTERACIHRDLVTSFFGWIGASKSIQMPSKIDGKV